HQFGAAAIAEHADEGIIAIEQFAAGSGHKDAFLGLLENQAIFFLCVVTIGGVMNDVDGALLLASLLAVGRGGNHAIATEAGVLSFLDAFLSDDAVGAAGPSGLARQYGFAGL